MTVLSVKTKRGLYKKRKKLLEPLTRQILEVGSGIGMNYQFYSTSAHIYALDPNKQRLQRKLPINYGICDDDLLSHIKHRCDCKFADPLLIT